MNNSLVTSDLKKYDPQTNRGRPTNIKQCQICEHTHEIDELKISIKPKDSNSKTRLVNFTKPAPRCLQFVSLNTYRVRSAIFKHQTERNIIIRSPYKEISYSTSERELIQGCQMRKTQSRYIWTAQGFQASTGHNKSIPFPKDLDFSTHFHKFLTESGLLQETCGGPHRKSNQIPAVQPTPTPSQTTPQQPRKKQKAHNNSEHLPSPESTPEANLEYVDTFYKTLQGRMLLLQMYADSL